MKICSKCKIEKDLSEFSKCEKNKDKLQYICKKCYSNYKKENKEYFADYDKNWKKNNKNYINYQKKWNKNKANYKKYASQISYADKIKNVDRFLQVKCTYCGKWYFPTNREIQNRIRALNINDGRENRLYCSEECKQVCPIYGQILWPKGYKQNIQTREVQPELRQMVFKRDNYTCLKCEKHQDELDVPLHCHHTEGILWNPLESADIDQCMTVCKNCHKEIHQQEDCRYVDMQCKN